MEIVHATELPAFVAFFEVVEANRTGRIVRALDCRDRKLLDLLRRQPSFHQRYSVIGEDLDSSPPSQDVIRLNGPELALRDVRAVLEQNGQADET